MARRNDPNDDAGLRKKRAQEQEQEQEQDSEKSEKKEGLSQQNQYGNQAVANMLGMSSVSPGSGGVSAMPSIRAASTTEAGDVQYGGDEDDDDDTPITIEELTKSWNPKTKKKDDTLRFIESMPEDELPPEDPDFIRQVKSKRAPHSSSAQTTIDGLIEPSTMLISSSLSRWCAGIQLWSSNTTLFEVIGGTISPGAPFLQDRSSRILHGRARSAAIGTCLLLQSPVLLGPARIQNALFIDYCMELYGRNHRLQNILKKTEESDIRIPKSSTLFLEQVGGTSGSAEARELCVDAAAQVKRVLYEMLAFRDPAVFIPDLSPKEPTKFVDEDPLNLDAILAEHTTVKDSDPHKRRYAQGLKSAEKMAELTTQTRVRLAAACVLISEVSDLWLKGAPNQTLHSITQSVDRQTEDILRMLVEIAQATKKESIPHRGIQNGLTRAARALSDLRNRIVETLTMVAASVLPSPPTFEFERLAPSSPLATALADGVPMQAMPWLESLPSSFERAVSQVFLRGIAGGTPEELLPQFTDLFHESKSMQESAEWLQQVLDIALGVCALRAGALDQALDSAKRQKTVGRNRRNGILIAQASLLAMESLHRQGNAKGAEEYRLRSAQDCWALGSRGGLTLLARWTPETS